MRCRSELHARCSARLRAAKAQARPSAAAMRRVGVLYERRGAGARESVADGGAHDAVTRCRCCLIVALIFFSTSFVIIFPLPVGLSCHSITMSHARQNMNSHLETPPRFPQPAFQHARVTVIDIFVMPTYI